MKKFIRKKENFTCRRCGFFVRGSGYTNHCPRCLWSRHVDVYPGDRQAVCRGMMEPVEIRQKSKDFIIVHRCQRCGYVNRNKMTPQDNFETAVEIAGKLANHD